MSPLDECKMRFRCGGVLASVMFNGNRVSRFEDGYSVEATLLWQMNGEVCHQNTSQSDCCVRVFIGTPEFRKLAGRPTEAARRRLAITC